MSGALSDSEKDSILNWQPGTPDPVIKGNPAGGGGDGSGGANNGPPGAPPDPAQPKPGNPGVANPNPSPDYDPNSGGGGSKEYYDQPVIDVGIVPSIDTLLNVQDDMSTFLYGGFGSGKFAGSPIFFQGLGGIDEQFLLSAPKKSKITNHTNPLNIGGWKGKGKAGGSLGALGIAGASGQPGPMQKGGVYTGGSTAPPPSVGVVPVYSNGQPDDRFSTLIVPRDPGHADYPGGTRTIVLESTDERKQSNILHHADERLVAANRGPSPSYGTPVVDLTAHGDISAARSATLQTMLRVVKGPRRLLTPGSTTDGSAQMPNVLSWNIGTTGLREALAGMMTDNSYGRNRHARVTRVDGGPFAIGPRGCKHRLGSDGDNDPILPLHLAAEALFSWDDSSQTLDGPLCFNPLGIGEYEERTGYVYRVDMAWDRGWQYLSGGVPYFGAWGWRVNVPIGTTTTPGDKPPPPVTTPKEPPPGGPTTPPGPPSGPNTPNIPSTPGNPGIPNLPPGSEYPPAPPPGADRLTITANATRNLQPADHAVVTTALGLTAEVYRPRLLVPGASDLTYNLAATPDQLAQYEKNAPAVLRAEVIGKQGGAAGGTVFGAAPTVGSAFVRTQEKTASVARGGTAAGGKWYMAPELGLEDVDAGLVGDSTRAASTSYVGMTPSVRLGFGLPDVSSGGMKSGFDFAVSSADLVVSKVGSTGTRTEHARFSANAVEIAGGVDLKLNGTVSGAISIKANGTTTSYSLVMPAAQGGASTVLQNDGSGGLSWAAKSVAAAQADSTAATLGDLVTDFNSLLAKLRAAGLMAP